MKLYTKTAATLSTVVLLGALAACGGGADRPSKDELADAITSQDSVIGSVPEEIADCVAGIFVDSDLSDETLDAMVEGDEDYKGSDDEQEIARDVMTDVTTECVPEVETPEPDEE